MQKSFVYKPKCQAIDCGDESKVKGLCMFHYQKAKRDEYRASAGYACRTRSCKNRTKSRALFCDECKSKPAAKKARKYATAAEREAFLLSRATCSVLGCDAHIAAETPKAVAHRLALCNRHSIDMTHKAMTLDAYLELMSITECQSCGSAGPLVTDHDHSCRRGHNNRNRMCPDCIRGRICSPCNTSLGSLGEDPERIRKLARYAERVAKVG